MGHNQDFWERLRTALARPIGAFVTGTRCGVEDPDRFVGYVEMGEEAFEEELHRMDFHRNPLSYWKKTLEYLGHEEGSWRKVDGDHQLHVILYTKDEYPDRTYIYSHWEMRWDRHPLAHLQGEDFSVSKGVNEMRRELQLGNVGWEDDPMVR